MRGTFETRSADTLVRREDWEVKVASTGTLLRAAGVEYAARDRKWSLDVRRLPSGGFESAELQVTPNPPPTEVTTTVFRTFGGRGFGTTIPPGGVPEKFETAFDEAGVIRGFSTALDGLALGTADMKVGHGRRLFVVALDGQDLRPRVRDALLLCRARSRMKTAAGEQWCNALEFRWADEPGRTETALTVTKSGLVVRAERPGVVPALTTQLVDFQA